MRKIKVAITGSTGLVGSRIIELLEDKFEFIQLKQPEFDITNKEKVRAILKDLNYDVFLHLAAYTNVDGAEKNKDLAWKVNVEGTKNVFEPVAEKKKNFIYISTDFVFDGKNPPYWEDSPTNPLGIYAKTKWEGEKIVKNNGMIVRISYPYRTSFPQKKDFVRAIKERLEKGLEVYAIKDTLITPTFIDDIAFALEYLIQNFSPEIFHIVGSKAYTAYEAVLTIADAFKLNKNLVKPISFEKFFKDRAPRPQYSDIRSKKNDFWRMKSLEETIEEFQHHLKT